jgi:hypothetical protein
MKRLALVAAAALVVACSDDRKEPAAEHATVETEAPVAAEDERAPILPGDATEHLTPELARKYEQTEPSADDWDTESFYAEIGPVLHELERLMTRESGFAPEDLEPLVHPGAGFSQLGVMSGLSFQDDTFTVRPEYSGEESPHDVVRPEPPALQLSDSLHMLLAPYEGHRASEVAFKVERVDAFREEAVSAQLVYSSTGRTKDGHLQQNGRWTTSWGRSDSGWKLGHAEGEGGEVELKGDRPTLFADATQAVLGGNRSYERQLDVGLEHWAGAVDGGLGMSVIGHEGLAVGDANGDGLDDLYVCQPGGLPNLLFLRQPDGTALDSSRDAGVDWLDASRSALFVDLDGDGDQDLVVEADPVLLLMENDGAGNFALKLEASAPSTTSLSAADADLDGDLDLFACGYMLPDEEERIPIPYHDANNGRRNTFLRNDSEGDAWAFTDATAEVGLDRNNRRYSFSAVWEDYDDDGDPDLYVANDFGRNNLYRNDAGQFVDVAGEAGVEDMAAGMGVTWADADLDGRMDLYVSNMYSSAGGRITYQRRFQEAASDDVRASYQRHARGNTLFRNLGDGTFADVSLAAGATMGRWAWGSLFTDFQNDGLPDLVVPNGFVTGEDPNDL